MGAIASQIISLTIVYSTVYSGADQSKPQSSASLAFVWGIHRRPVNSPHKWPVTRKMFPFDDVIMSCGFPRKRPVMHRLQIDVSFVVTLNKLLNKPSMGCRVRLLMDTRLTFTVLTGFVYIFYDISICFECSEKVWFIEIFCGRHFSMKIAMGHHFCLLLLCCIQCWCCTDKTSLT